MPIGQGQLDEGMLHKQMRDIHKKNRDYLNQLVNGTTNAELPVIHPSHSQGAFGGQITIAEESIVGMKFTSGFIQTDLYQTLTNGASTVTVDDARVKMVIGTGVGDYALVRTKRSVQYQPGKGVPCYFAGSFDSDNAVANSFQAYGMGNASSGLYFGYNGATFGVLRQTGGKAEIQTLTISTAASSSATVTIKLNDVSYTVDVTNAAGDADFTAYEIATKRDWVSDGWNVFSRDDTVIFEKRGVGPATGEYTYSASTSGSVATFLQNQAGVADTKNWTAQSAWNVDPLDGTGPSGMTLNPGLNNVYKIQMQWLGAGAIKYFVENPATGNLILVHVDPYPNTSQEVSVLAPDMFIQASLASLGSTTAMTGYLNSAVMKREGSQTIETAHFTVDNNLVNISANTETVLFSLRNNFVNASGFTSYGTLAPELLSISSESNKVVRIRIRINADIGAGTTGDYPAWTGVDSNSIADQQLGTNTVANGRLRFVQLLGKTDSQNLNLRELGLSLNKGETLTVTAETANATNDITAALIFAE